MRFGVREICDVVLKAKAAQKIGNKVFYRNEPVCYFDSLKTSSLEGAATTVYATGGRGNPRLIAWEGERTVTFTMEDALISPTGFMILSGAGLVEASSANTIKVHTTEQLGRIAPSSVSAGAAGGPGFIYSTTVNNNVTSESVTIRLSNPPYIPGIDLPSITSLSANSAVTVSITSETDSRVNEDFMYVMVLKNGEVVSEPFIPSEVQVARTGDSSPVYYVTIKDVDLAASGQVQAGPAYNHLSDTNLKLTTFANCDAILVDYYVEKQSGAYQIDITPDKFGGNFYLEASTLFRDTNGVDMPAEFIIPNCKVQSNFTFTMAATGDPSTFTFTMDAFPDYTRWDKTKKVLAAIQVIDTSTELVDLHRLATEHDYSGAKEGYDTNQKQYIEID